MTLNQGKHVKRVKPCHQCKVAKLDIAIMCDDNIFRMQIAIDNASVALHGEVFCDFWP